MTQYYIDENNTKKEKKKKTGPTGLLSIILIALAVTFLGDIIGILPVIGLSALTDDGGWRFVLDSYFPFLGSFILMLVYMANWDRELYVTALPASRGGLKGNTVKWLLLGLLFGFVINGFCALIAYLHGDLKFSVGSFDVIYMAVALILVGIQSSTEELIFRCYVFQAVRRRYGLAMGVVVNSVFFALMHGANPGIGPLPILDLLLWGVFCSLIVHYSTVSGSCAWSTLPGTTLRTFFWACPIQALYQSVPSFISKQQREASSTTSISALKAV